METKADFFNRIDPKQTFSSLDNTVVCPRFIASVGVSNAIRYRFNT